MINNKISLFLDNVNTFIFIKCAALTLTMKNKKADADKINHCRDILKNNTSLFSNFRGNNMLTSSANNTALTITLAIQMATTAAIAGATAAAATSASSN